jgi:hypothetical protein
LLAPGGSGRSASGSGRYQRYWVQNAYLVLSSDPLICWFLGLTPGVLERQKVWHALQQLDRLDRGGRAGFPRAGGHWTVGATGASLAVEPGERAGWDVRFTGTVRAWRELVYRRKTAGELTAAGSATVEDPGGLLPSFLESLAT